MQQRSDHLAILGVSVLILVLGWLVLGPFRPAHRPGAAVQPRVVTDTSRPLPAARQ